MLCETCGEELLPGREFCPKCGAKTDQQNDIWDNFYANNLQNFPVVLPPSPESGLQKLPVDLPPSPEGDLQNFPADWSEDSSALPLSPAEKKFKIVRTVYAIVFIGLGVLGFVGLICTVVGSFAAIDAVEEQMNQTLDTAADSPEYGFLASFLLLGDATLLIFLEIDSFLDICMVILFFIFFLVSISRFRKKKKYGMLPVVVLLGFLEAFGAFEGGFATVFKFLCICTCVAGIIVATQYLNEFECQRSEDEQEHRPDETNGLAAQSVPLSPAEKKFRIIRTMYAIVFIGLGCLEVGSLWLFDDIGIAILEDYLFTLRTLFLSLYIIGVTLLFKKKYGMLSIATLLGSLVTASYGSIVLCACLSIVGIIVAFEYLSQFEQQEPRE